LLGTRKIKKTTTAGEVSGRTGKEGQEDGKHTDHRWQTGRCNVVLLHGQKLLWFTIFQQKYPGQIQLHRPLSISSGVVR